MSNDITLFDNNTTVPAHIAWSFNSPSFILFQMCLFLSVLMDFPNSGLQVFEGAPVRSCNGSFAKAPSIQAKLPCSFAQTFSMIRTHDSSALQCEKQGLWSDPTGKKSSIVTSVQTPFQHTLPAQTPHAFSFLDNINYLTRSFHSQRAAKEDRK